MNIFDLPEDCVWLNQIAIVATATLPKTVVYFAAGLPVFHVTQE